MIPYLNYLKVGAPNKQTGTQKAHWVCTKASQSAVAYNLKGRLLPVSHGGCRGGGALLQAVVLRVFSPQDWDLWPQDSSPYVRCAILMTDTRSGSRYWRVPLYIAAWTWRLAQLLTCHWPKQATWWDPEQGSSLEGFLSATAVGEDIKTMFISLGKGVGSVGSST